MFIRARLAVQGDTNDPLPARSRLVEHKQHEQHERHERHEHMRCAHV
jgi:hypothetical protein